MPLLLFLRLLIYLIPLAAAHQKDLTVGDDKSFHISFFDTSYRPGYHALPASIPAKCHVNFVKALVRHGTRFPRKKDNDKWRLVIQKIQMRAQRFPGRYGFLRTYRYVLADDSMTSRGKEEMKAAGASFCRRYRGLAAREFPSLVAIDKQVPRHAEAPGLFVRGFERACPHAGKPGDVALIANPKGPKGPQQPMDTWLAQILLPIVARMNRDLGTHDALDGEDVHALMELCRFATAASAFHRKADFCRLFTPTEWRQYIHWLVLKKYYQIGDMEAAPNRHAAVADLLAKLEARPRRPHLHVELTNLESVDPQSASHLPSSAHNPSSG